MKHMKITEKEKEGMMKPSTVNTSEESYPYGLRIHLNDAEIKKLGFQGLPKVGQAMELTGKVKVVDVSAHDGEGGKVRSIGLQITHMDLDDEATEKPDKADVLYGKSK